MSAALTVLAFVISVGAMLFMALREWVLGLDEADEWRSE